MTHRNVHAPMVADGGKVMIVFDGRHVAVAFGSTDRSVKGLLKGGRRARQAAENTRHGLLAAMAHTNQLIGGDWYRQRMLDVRAIDGWLANARG